MRGNAGSEASPWHDGCALNYSYPDGRSEAVPRFPTMPIVELRKIRKVYDTKVAVEGLSLTIEPGTMFGLLGPNGSGKTSSIRMMIGMTMPDSGTVSLFGKPFERAALHRVGYLPEERGLYKKMKVLDQLVFLGQLHGLSESTARSRSLLWCERMEITEAIEKKTEELSKGMQQKIQFIAALLHEPELVIMDEPFSGLDPVNAQLLMDTLIALRGEGKAVLFSTHRMDQVEKMCDSIALISRGKLVLSGSMREVKASYPKNRVQVSFAGDDSFLRHAEVAEAKNYAGIAEVQLHREAGAQMLLAEAIARGTQISRFEVKEPTLEEIFIEQVRASFGDEEARGIVDA
jgi:ABC-2 type transport system ATP-binding protein